MRPLPCLTAGALLLAPLLAAPLAAQEQRPGFGLGALGLHVGVATIEHAKTGFIFGGSVDLGSVGTPRARIVVDIDRLHADIDRKDVLGNSFGGSFTDVSGSAGINYRVLTVKRVTPYIGVGIGFHSLSTNTSNPTGRDIYSGTQFGVHGAVGASWVLGDAGRYAATGEIRGDAAKDVGRTAFLVGLSVLFGPLVTPRPVASP